MLYENAITPAALELLKQLSSCKELDEFGLGGGTSIALRIGHRISIDLDFFINKEFDTARLFDFITKKFPSAELLFEKNQTLLFIVNDIKTDFVLYPFPWLHPFEVTNGIKLVSIYDIIPMKLQAVSIRNAKKDYWDISALLQQFTLQEMLTIFKNKFPQIDTGFIVHSLTDFEKADTERDPDKLTNITWEDIKSELNNKVRQFTEESL